MKGGFAKLSTYMRDAGRVFVLSFMILLVMALVMEARGYSDVAEEYGVYAYYFLVVGVILIALGSVRDSG
ncbi:hypothetical protein apy_11560 [Aeropyrum pernix]|uniref:Uncharacterized protein n=1 Tax=Aeropyrum pernix TaxID=56636 RepID=A0A401HAF6_AERPX|nr:hypothetical protein [Aeropyrum pernix]GBF09431.1 hypothetical protein apy_11560 [Aeropyrum pernix]